MEKTTSFFLGNRVRAVLTGTVVFALVSGTDYFLRNEISIDVFYFLPIFVLTWHVGRRWGLAGAALSVVVWLTDERVFAPDFADKYHIVLWNAVVRLAFFSVVVFLMHALKTIVARERAVSRLKSAMIHTVSHEFNNALTGLSTGLFLLKEIDAAAVEEQRETLYTSMEASLHKLQMYVKNILNEARMEEGKFKIEKRPIALRDLARGAAADLAEVLRQKEIGLRMVLPEKTLVVNADPEALALVVSNLLSNAAKYTGRGGAITVRVEPSGAAGVMFSVEDTGIGISLEDLNKLTTGFYRTADGRGRAEGFGLGLKIANDLLELHGSRLEVNSEKGKGSRFFFLLPFFAPAGGRGL